MTTKTSHILIIFKHLHFKDIATFVLTDRLEDHQECSVLITSVYCLQKFIFVTIAADEALMLRFLTLEQLSDGRSRNLAHGFPPDTTMDDLFPFKDRQAHKGWLQVFHAGRFKKLIRFKQNRRRTLAEYWRAVQSAVSSGNFVSANSKKPTAEDLVRGCRSAFLFKSVLC